MDVIFSGVISKINNEITIDLTTVIVGLCFLGLLLYGFLKIQILFDSYICDKQLGKLGSLRGGEFSDEDDTDGALADVRNNHYKKEVARLSGSKHCRNKIHDN